MRELDKKLNSYVRKNKYSKLIHTLSTSKDSLQGRFLYLEELRNELEEEIKLIKNSVSTLSKDEISIRLKKMEQKQLQFILNLNILAEIFVNYFGIIRKDFKILGTAITEFEPLGKGGVKKEEEMMGKVSLKNISYIFKLPSNVVLQSLSSEEKNILNEKLKELKNTIRKDLKAIANYRKSYISIYNKYKHSLCEQTGMFAFNNNSLHATIYLVGEDKTEDRRFRRNKIKKTYIVATGDDVFAYYDSIALKLYQVFNFLLDSTWLFIFNYGKKTYPMLNNYFCPSLVGKENEFKAVLSKMTHINHGKIPAVLETITYKDYTKIAKKFKKNNFVATINRDIFCKSGKLKTNKTA